MLLRYHRLIWLALAALLLSSCSRPGMAPASSGPTLSLAEFAYPPSLDPVQANGGNASMYLQSVFSGLMRYDGSGQLVPDLAAKWTVSADRTIYTFTLRSNAHFQNGDPVTAQSLLYAINRACDPKSGSPVAGDYLDIIRGVTERLAGKADTVSGVTAPSADVVQFTLIKPDSSFLARLTFPVTFALDKATVDAGGPNWWQRPNGSGPFRLTQWQPDNAAVLERFDGYYGPPPSVAKVVLHSATVLNNLPQAFANGSLDLLPLGPPDIASLLDPSSNVPPQLRQALHVYDRSSLEYLAFNIHKAPFDTLAARVAVNLSINRQQLVASALGGDGWPAHAILPPGFPGYQPNVDPYPFNVAAAKAALQSSRTTAGTPIVFASAERLPNGQPGPVTSAIAAMLQQGLGLQIQLRYVPEPDLDTMLAAGKPPGDISLTGWQADYLDDQDFLDLLFHTGRRSNLMQYSSQAVDHLLDVAAGTAGTSERVALYQQAQTAILHDAPIAPLYFDREFALLNPRVSRLSLLPDGSYDLRDATISSSPPATAASGAA